MTRMPHIPPGEDDHDALQWLSNECSKVSSWNIFSEYCDLREKGFRKESLNRLNEFIQQTHHWAESERREFTRVAVDASRRRPFSAAVLPQPLREEVVQPTLDHWIAQEPDNPEPLRLRGGREDLCKALDLDPSHQDTVLRVARFMEGDIYFACHESEIGIIGEAELVLSMIEEYQEVLSLIEDEEKRARLTKEARIYQEVVENYQQYMHERENGESGSFRDWAVARGLRWEVPF